MAHTDEFKRKLRLGTACTLLSAMGVAGVNPAYAQDAAADDEDLEVEEVVVTGSRIKRTGFDTVNPATVVDSEFLELRAFANVAQALNELPSFGIPGASENGGQAGQNVGQNFVNAFGLGSQRTLTLINGRRVVSQSSVSVTGIGVAGSGIQVDLNTIPTALIDRVETIYTGGAPIYGSDAIAGTVNVILKDDFEGLNVDLEYGISDENDAENYRYRTLVGGNFADGRGNVVVSMEYARQDGLLTNARPYLATGAGFVNNEANVGAADGIADLRFTTDTNGVFQVLEPGVPLAAGSSSHQLGASNSGLLFSGGRDAEGNGIGVPLIFGLNGGLVDAAVANIGTRPTDTAGRNSIFFSNGSNAINNPYVLSTNEANSLVSPLERYTFTQLSHFDITDNIRWFSEAAYSRSESTDEINQPSWSTTFFGPGINGTVRLNVADNPFITDEIRDVLALNNDGELPEFLDITRTNTDIQQGNVNSRDQDSFRFVTGFEGDFEAFGRSWNWDVSYSYGETNASTSNANLNGVRYALALDAIADPETGRPVCRSSVEGFGDGLPDQFGGVTAPATPSDITECVPINVIGYSQFGDDVRDYLIQNNISTLALQQTVVEGSIAGDIVDLPAGPVGLAIGVTHRRERGRFDVDQGLEVGIDPTAPTGAVAGGFDTDEVYGEALIPLVTNGEGLGDAVGSIINNFNIEGALRFVDNSVAGGDYTWTIGGRLNLNLPGIGDAITFRGNYTEAIRSPSITELFAPQVQTFNFAQDPCENRFIGNGPDPATRRANCEAQFASLASTLDPAVDFDTYVSVITNASQPGFTGGNPNLQNEQSESYTIGFVFEPEFIPGFTLSSDYTNLEVTDVIQSLTATQVANACYDSTSFPNEPSCSQFTRNATTFQLENFITGQVNAARRRLEAIITDASYTFDLADISDSLGGTMNLTANYFLLLKSDLQVGSADLDVLDRERNHLRHRWQVNANYQLDRWSALLQWRHESGGLFSNEDSDDRRDIFRFKDFNTYNATIRYQITDNVAARFVVQNIFDNLGNETRLASAGGNSLNFSEFIGRRFQFGINVNF